MSTCLIADLGGTNARFALVDLAQPTVLRRRWTLQAADFATVELAVSHCLDRLEGQTAPALGLFAVAAVVTGDAVQFINNGWSFSVSALQDSLGLADLRVVNDFAAAAWAVPGLTSDQLEGVCGPVMLPMARGDQRLLLGPGTGLGLAAVHWTEQALHVVATEGGHVGFAPANAEEQAILGKLLPRFGRVSAERLLSGEGLVALYHALGGARNNGQAAQITALAAAGDALACKCLADFGRLLGRFAGDAVLMHGAWAGVVLTGGVLEAAFSPAAQAAFGAGFVDKGRYAQRLAAVPVAWSRAPDMGIAGASLMAANIFRQRGPNVPC
jgi:glucokinase